MRKSLPWIKYILLTASIIWVCAGCGQTLGWVPAEEYEEGYIEGISLYANRLSITPGSKSIDIIVLNESDEDVYFGKLSESSIQKEIDGKWNTVDLEKRDTTSTIKWECVYSGEAICISIDISELIGVMTTGKYRVELIFYKFEDVGAERNYLYCNFDIPG